jgi:group I intron endonuclease
MLQVKGIFMRNLISGIYTITSPTGKVYVGQSWNIHKRWLSYKRVDCVSQPKIYRSLKKYGAENHIFRVMNAIPKINTQKEMNYWEGHMISAFRTLGVKMLNIREAGANGKVNEETKIKISNGNKGKRKGRFLKEENPYYGKKHSEEIRLKMSISNKGKKLGDKNGRARKIVQILNDVEIKYYSTVTQASIELKTSRQNISDVLNGRNKTALGYTFKYV